MSVSKYVDSLYGELSLLSTGEDAGMSDDVLKRKPFRTRARVGLARAAVRVCPAIVEQLLNHPYTRNGYEVVGYGFQSTVIKVGHEVLKVMRRSAYADDSWRHTTIDTLRSRQSVAAQYLGIYLVPQEFSVEAHPAFKGRQTIVARQPYIEYEPSTHETNQVGDILKAADIEQVLEFTRGALAMLAAHQLLPDILGTHNIILHEDRLLLLDSVPIARTDNPSGFDKIAYLLQNVISTSE